MKKEEQVFNDIDGLSCLTKTSFYRTLQDAVSKLVKLISPNYLIELGCGSGDTTIRLAEENVNSSIVAVDVVKDRLVIGQNKLLKKKPRNIAFVESDFMNLGNFNLQNANLILMVYSFNYISDPLQNKEVFLRSIYKELQEGAYVLIGETFLLDKQGQSKESIDLVFNARIKEVVQNIFWNNISGLQENDVEWAQRSTEILAKGQKDLAKEVFERKDRFLISKKWLVDTAKSIGFKVVIESSVNAFGDGIVLLQK